ncbi:hypothetical protein [Parahaliea mediterranea]|uniref:hypothetical protein n=1 Tax=Parahaliea mediterranea TaxID=651086 RepID=UPI0013005344|nr:hypothetical protein [Parahaliea mediterranea]
MKKYTQSRLVPVVFENSTAHPLDISLFDTNAYATIQGTGFKTTPLRIIRSAMVHYSGRFPDSSILRFTNSLIDLIQSLDGVREDGHFYIREKEAAEFQTRSSEVLAVGLCLDLASKLFSVNRNRFYVIDGSRKRCDFYFEKNGLRYLLEAKGRKGSISSARNDIFDKKLASGVTTPKYGFISQIPRGSKPTKMTVVDPDYVPSDFPRHLLIYQLLFYYSKLTKFAGFWRLSELLASRARAVRRSGSVVSFDNSPLDLGNVEKLGSSVVFEVNGVPFTAFFPRNFEKLISFRFENFTSIFPIDKLLVEILERQDYEKLLSYHGTELAVQMGEGVSIESSEDGSSTMLISDDRLEEIKSLA